MSDIRYVSPEDFDRITQELDKARELREADTSKMTLAVKVAHQRAIKEAMDRMRGIDCPQNPKADRRRAWTLFHLG